MVDKTGVVSEETKCLQRKFGFEKAFETHLFIRINIVHNKRWKGMTQKCLKTREEPETKHFSKGGAGGADSRDVLGNSLAYLGSF